jgi:hypothetical protein
MRVRIWLWRAAGLFRAGLNRVNGGRYGNGRQMCHAICPCFGVTLGSLASALPDGAARSLKRGAPADERRAFVSGVFSCSKLLLRSLSESL